MGSNAGKAVAVYLFNQLCTAAADNNAVFHNMGLVNGKCFKYPCAVGDDEQ